MAAFTACALIAQMAQSRGMSLGQIAKASGLQYEKVRRIVSGLQDPKGSDLEALAAVFGIDDPWRGWSQ